MSRRRKGKEDNVNTTIEQFIASSDPFFESVMMTEDHHGESISKFG
jgi:hypothetical protein